MKIVSLVRSVRCCVMLAAVVAAASCGRVNATPIFSEDFNDITVTGSNLTTATVGNSFNTTATTGATNTAIVRADSGNLFGAGTSNQYLEMIDTTTAAGITLRKQSIAGIAVGGVAQLSFDFYDPSGEFDGTTDDTVVFTLDSGSGATTSMSLRLRNVPNINDIVFFNAAVDPINYVTVKPYSEGAKHSAIALLNYGASAVTYAGRSLAPQTFDVWLDGAFAGSNYPFFNSVTSNNRLTISTSGGATAAVNIDNVVLDSEITVVPEPCSYVLAAVALFGGNLIRKRRVKR